MLRAAVLHELVPQFLHHPLIMKSAGQKLSKSDRDSGIRELRATGWTPEQVIAHAMSLVGVGRPVAGRGPAPGCACLARWESGQRAGGAGPKVDEGLDVGERPGPGKFLPRPAVVDGRLATAGEEQGQTEEAVQSAPDEPLFVRHRAAGRER